MVPFCPAKSGLTWSPTIFTLVPIRALSSLTYAALRSATGVVLPLSAILHGAALHVVVAEGGHLGRTDSGNIHAASSSLTEPG
jgi:hypothetical protein